ncbi:MAG TPA: hypothetical protein PKA95_10585 [Thermomicrobiales bacterium]|nr:hypothetical protein [Thermomicrobiales bacterium]
MKTFNRRDIVRVSNPRSPYVGMTGQVLGESETRAHWYHVSFFGLSRPELLHVSDLERVERLARG